MGDLGGPYDAIIIGSGISGLTAAIILAKHGKKVLVIEQHYRFGGYLQSFMLHRTPFDSGCHYVGSLGKDQVFDRYLRYLGVRDAIQTYALDPEGFDVLRYSGWSFAMPVGYARYGERLIERFPKEREAILRFLGEIQREIQLFPMYTLEPADDPRGRSNDAERTLAAVMAECGVSDPKLWTVLSAYQALYFVRPEEAPFSMHAFVFDSFIRGAFTVHGGGNSIAKAMVARVRALGGVARRRCRVANIEVSDGAVRGIRTSTGEVEEAPLVLACIDPKVALSLLPPGAVRPVYRHRIDRLVEGLGGLGAYLRVDADLSRFAGANHWLYQAETGDALFDGSWLERGESPPLFVTVPSVREQSWKGPATVILLSGMSAAPFAEWAGSTTGVRDPGYDAKKNEIGGRMVAAASELIPELRTNLLTADYSTPLTHRDYTLNSSGAIYGIHHSIDQSAGRGVGWRTRVKGFLLSGHSVLYPGLIGATISAFYTCGELLGLSALHTEVRKA